MKIAICDDNQAFSQSLRAKIISYFALIDKRCQCEIFLSPESLLNADLAAFHVIFLDVDMPGINGIEVAHRLRKHYADTFIVFVTGWIEYAPAGYCVNAFRYLLKQRLDDELFRCLDDIREKMARGQARIQLQGREYPIELPLDQILYFEGSSYRMVQVHLCDGTMTECRGRLSDLADVLEGKGFLRIQKSFIVNMQHILKIKSYRAVLKNGIALKTTERNYSQICNEYLIWKGRQL